MIVSKKNCETAFRIKTLKLPEETQALSKNDSKKKKMKETMFSWCFMTLIPQGISVCISTTMT